MNSNPQSRDYTVPDRLELVVPAGCAGLRLDQALAQMLPEHSRSRLARWIREQRVTVNGAPATPSSRVWGGESLVVEPAEEEAVADAPEAIGLEVIHEDAEILVVAKPPGLVVHPGAGNPGGTLLNALLNHSPGLAAVPRAGIVHRLDKDTSGLLVVAKTLQAQTALVRAMKQREISRDYLALVHGRVEQPGRVEAPIGRHPTVRTRMAVVSTGRPAATRYEVREHLPGCTLLALRLESGRTHQIRVHMHSIGHSIVGDPVYGGRPRDPAAAPLLRAFPRQALHAYRLALQHPASGRRLRFEAPIPQDLEALLKSLRALEAE